MSMHAQGDRDRIRHDPKLVRKVVHALDQGAAPPVADADQRELNRHSYHIQDLAIDIQHGAGIWKRYSVPTRDISDSGMSILLGRFIYPRTPVRIHLTNIYNYSTVVSGVVARCRYIPATPGLHEVGIRFDRKIDFSVFRGGTPPARMILVDDTPRMQRMIRTMLPAETAQVTVIRTTEKLSQRLLAESFEIVLIRADMPGLDLIALVGGLRDAGCVEPLIGYSSCNDDSLKTRGLEAGMDLWLPTPISSNALTTLVKTLKKTPVVSSFIYQPEMIEAIDEFSTAVRGVAKKILQLSAQENHTELTQRIEQLEAEADHAGFERITNACRQLRSQLADVEDPAALRLKINQLVRLCYAVRGATCAELPVVLEK